MWGDKCLERKGTEAQIFYVLCAPAAAVQCIAVAYYQTLKREFSAGRRQLLVCVGASGGVCRIKACRHLDYVFQSAIRDNVCGKEIAMNFVIIIFLAAVGCALLYSTANNLPTKFGEKLNVALTHSDGLCAVGNCLLTAAN